MRPGAWILAGSLLAAPPPAPPAETAAPTPVVTAPSPSLLDRVSALLHDGRFEAARATLAASGREGSPERLFLEGFVTYWTLIFDDDNDALEARLDREMAAAIDAADAESGSADPAAAIWGGTSHLILAGLRAGQRRPFAAAFEAKKAKKALERAASAGTHEIDALFGLGTYNYMADTVPAYVKGLRALLFLPKGDRDLGLAQLQKSADATGGFAFESRALLVTIYANRHERRYAEAVHERDGLLARDPEAMAALYASARLDLSLARDASGLATIARAERRAAELRDVDPVVLRSLDILRARLEFDSLRPDLAAETARRALASGAGLGISIRADLESIRAAAEANAPGIAWSTVESADAARLAQLAEETPSRPLLALLAGDAALKAGRGDDALRWLDRAAAAALPPGLLGGCLLRQGRAADLVGDRKRAIAAYKRASETPGFAAKDAAAFHLTTPYPGTP